jgi:hypothetical protein
VAVLPRVFLAFTDHWDIPCPQILNEFAVRLAGVVKLLKLIALPIRGHIECRKMLLAADHEGTTDHAVVVLAVNRCGTEKELAGSLETGKETT